MSFCPGSAAVRAGDPLQVYPEALRRMEMMGEALAGADGMETAAPGRAPRAVLPIVS
jgi:hypothetical protein